MKCATMGNERRKMNEFVYLVSALMSLTWYGSYLCSTDCADQPVRACGCLLWYAWCARRRLLKKSESESEQKCRINKQRQQTVDVFGTHVALRKTCEKEKRNWLVLCINNFFGPSTTVNARGLTKLKWLCLPFPTFVDPLNGLRPLKEQ